ncbi:hypothetical protein CsatA_016866 [Cannabis sativa]
MSSILQYPDTMDGPDLQVWNNAAFDDDDFECSASTIKASWSTLHSDLVNRSFESFESDYSKENLSPGFMKTPVTVKSSVPIKPLQPNSAILNSHGRPLKFEHFLKEGQKERDEKKIDSEIEEIEIEISRLSSRLEALRIEKAERNKKTIERRGRIIPAKFLEPKPSVKIEESTKPKSNRRGLSLGPSEIISGAGFRRLSKIEITPVQTIQNRRKSCFWKLQDIDELRVTKERGKSLSLSPKSRKTTTKTQPPPKQAATTVGSKRAVKKEEAVISSIQPKKLFKEGEKSVAAKKPVKTGRVVASRYNQTPGNDGRKRSLPEDDKDESRRNDNKKRMSFTGKQRGGGRELCRSQGTENRMKKKWEIPHEVVVFKGLDEEECQKSPLPETLTADVLPKIKIFRCVKESPRDSGPAKRVVELIGKKSYFCSDDKIEGPSSFCQALSFAEEKMV